MISHAHTGHGAALYARFAGTPLGWLANYVCLMLGALFAVTHHIEEFKVASVQCRDNVLAWGKIASGEATLAEDGTITENASGETTPAEDGTATEAGQPTTDSARTATPADPAESQP